MPGPEGRLRGRPSPFPAAVVGCSGSSRSTRRKVRSRRTST